MKHADSPSAIVIRTAIECSGFVSDGYHSMESLMRSARRQDHAALIFDGDLDSKHAHSLVKWRSDWLDASVAILAYGQDSPMQAAKHLDHGVDDYVRLPIQGVEFIARLKAALRKRYVYEQSSSVQVGSCSLDVNSYALVSSTSRVGLTQKELGIAQLLFDNAGQTVSRERLAQDVWGADSELSKRSIEQHIYQLRRKLKQCAAESVTLRATYGGGYKLVTSVGDNLSQANPNSLIEQPKS